MLSLMKAGEWNTNCRIGEELGSGQFGMVRRGRWTVNPENTIPVAVKTMRTNFTFAERIEFLQEGAIMAQFRHPNVVTLYGVTEKNEQARNSKYKVRLSILIHVYRACWLLNSFQKEIFNST